MAISNYDPGQDLASIDFQAMIGTPLIAVIEAQAQAAYSTVDFIKSVGFTPDVEDPITFEVTPGSPVYVSFKYSKQVAPYQPAGNGEITSILLGSGGTGYTEPPSVTISGGGTGASATATISDGKVVGVSIINAGSGYSSPTVAFSGGGGGAGASATAEANNADAVAATFQEMALEVPLLTMVNTPSIRIEEVEIDFHAKINSTEYKEVGTQFKGSLGYSSSSNLGVKFGSYLSYNRTAKFSASLSYQRTSTKGFKIDKTYQLGVRVKAVQDLQPAGLETILGILEDAIVSQPVL